jgi:tetratricopeptide (TPR) repeat protein
MSTATTNKMILLFPENATNVELKREGWNQYIPVGFGTALHPTDLVKSDGLGSILCPDLTVQPIPEQGRPPCPLDQGWLEYNEYKFGSGSRGPSKDIPYIIFPRNTALINPNPLLQWRDTNASSYTVSITQNGETIWEDDNVVGNSIQYPTSAPQLMAGTDYLLVVEDNDTGYSSVEDPAKGLGFELLDDESINRAEKRRGEILNQTMLDESAKKLTLAVYYVNLEFQGTRRLWGEAWLVLDDLAKSQKAPVVYLQMGNVLSAMKLHDEAEETYETALHLAETLRDIETQAVAYVGLWQLLGDPAYLDKAVSLYEDLGDQTMVEKLK